VEPPIWAWIALIAAVPVLTAVDFFVFGRGRKEISVRSATIWTLAWVALGLSFTAILAATQGGDAAGEYVAGYLVEWSLSIDNLFVFAVIFSYFAVPKDLQPRVLLFGVLGALIFRGIFIAIGAAALGAAHWVIYVFGAFLIFTAYRLATTSDQQVDPGRNALLRLVSRFVPTTSDYRGVKVFVREHGRRLATPIFAVLLVVASTDVVFAIDSIPAIFAITDEAFIVLAANIFAVLGLRAAYFVIVGALDRFEYLHYGLAAVLALVGLKMLTSEVYDPQVWMTLGAVVVILGTAVAASWWASRRRERDAREVGPPPPVGTPAP
jgi:tellurite resistance protein TerC